MAWRLPSVAPPLAHRSLPQDQCEKMAAAEREEDWRERSQFHSLPILCGFSLPFCLVLFCPLPRLLSSLHLPSSSLLLSLALSFHSLSALLFLLFPLPSSSLLLFYSSLFISSSPYDERSSRSGAGPSSSVCSDAATPMSLRSTSS